MRILVITRSSWSNNNNIGNTMTNIFNSFDSDHIYGLNFRSEPSVNNIAIKNLSISEQQIIRYFKTGKQIGQISESCAVFSADNEKKMYDNAKKKSGKTLWFLREFLWSVAPWKNSLLNDYLDEVKPDVVFMPVFCCWYTHKVLKYIIEYTGAKLFLFHADDNYTLKQFSLSPLYWIYRFVLRKWVRSSVKMSDMNYAISEIQKIEYEKIFKKQMNILYKSSDFEIMPQSIEQNIPLKLLFTGNINSGRYKSLSLIGKSLSKINQDGIKAQLDIYTLTPLTSKMKKALDIPNAVFIKGAVSNDKVQELQKKADILVHVEAFDLKSRLRVRQSFSTKIVDYLKNAKCILAIGPRDVASIDYLKKNDAAVVAASQNEIEEKLKTLIESPALIQNYGQKAWECGKRNHQSENITKMLKEDFYNC